MTQSDRPQGQGPAIGSSGPVVAASLDPAGSGPTSSSPHRPAGDTEEVYFEGTPLLRGEIGRGFGWIFLGLVLIAAPILLRIFTDKWAAKWVNLGALVVGLIFLLIPFLRAKTIRYRVTNYRIDFEKGLLGRNIETIELWHVEDLRFHQSLADRILGIGTIIVMSRHPTLPLLTMRSIPNAQQLFKTLEQRVISVKRASGVIKVDQGI